MTRSFRVVLVLGGVAVLSAAKAQDARFWLNRMNEAVEALNYQGTFVHAVGDTYETLHIIHRNADGDIGERIVSLNGAGSEIVRQGDHVQCILPDQKVVLLEDGAEQSPLDSLPVYSDSLEANYNLQIEHEDRILNRPTQVIAITPKDEYRYGYHLWLDMQTAMPLKTQLWGDDQSKLEEIFFTNIEYPDSIPESALEATIDTKGYKIIRSPDAPAGPIENIPWQFPGLPSGFRLSVWMNRTIAGSQYPVQHYVFQDGLATVSVFIEDPKADPDVAEGFSTVGTTNTFSLTKDGRKVTAVGEVPRRTVQGIATSLTFK